MQPVKAQVLVPAYPCRAVTGPAMHIVQAISFWGGVSPATGLLIDTRSQGHGKSIANTVLFVRHLRGSSSASSVLLELIYKRLAPAALVLHSPDAILALGALVAREIDLVSPPILRLEANEQDRIPIGAQISIEEDGTLAYG
jgi:uncharacterized protein